MKLDVFVAFSALVRQRGATASDEERAQLATDAAEDTTALVKQLRATRSAKLRVCRVPSPPCNVFISKSPHRPHGANFKPAAPCRECSELPLIKVVNPMYLHLFPCNETRISRQQHSEHLHRFAM